MPKPQGLPAEKRKISNPAGEDGWMDGGGGYSPQPRGVGSAKRTQSRNLGQPGGFRFKHIFGTTSSHGEKRWAELQFDIRAKVCMYGWMDGNGSHVLLLGNAFYVCSYIYCTWDG